MACAMHSKHKLPLPGRPPLELGPRPIVMGILNLTPDSFSDGGLHQPLDQAVSRARAMVEEGADIIDVGGESTRPGATPVGVQEELDRVMPVLDALLEAGISVPLSIDTTKPVVADQAMQAGAAIINDVRGLQGAEEMAAVAALHGAAIVAMHWEPDRKDGVELLDAIDRYFERTIAIAEKAGIASDRIMLDPGFGFGKSLSENYHVLNKLGALRSSPSTAACPILVGTSRKSMIGHVLHNQVDERLAGTVATNVLGYSYGAHIFRVHDIRANRDALRVAQATLYGPTPEAN